MQDGVDERRPYIAFWRSIGGKHWGCPQRDKFSIYSLVTGGYVGTFIKVGSCFISYRGSILEPENYGDFHRCVELKEKWVSIASLRNSTLERVDWENIVNDILQKRRTEQMEELDRAFESVTDEEIEEELLTPK